MSRLWLPLTLFLCLAPAVGHADDAQTLSECVSLKAGPEGDLPPAGAARDKILADMAGGPQACIGLVEKACSDAGGDGNKCIARESAAWIAALKRNLTFASPRNRQLYMNGISGLEARAKALCESAAAVSAWGSETVKTKGKAGLGADTICVRDGIAQQSIIVLVNRRGN